MSWIERFEVAPNCDGWRLDNFLTHRLKRASRAKVARIIHAETVSLESGRKVKAGTIVRTGDVVLVRRVERTDPAAPALEAIQVLHASQDLVVLNKPPGTLVHRTAHEATKTVDVFLDITFPGERVEPAHRLDRDTSGILLCGRGIEAIRAMTVAFEMGAPKKRYRAVVADPERRWAAGQTQTFAQPLGFDTASEVQLKVGPGDWTCTTTATCVRTRDGLAELEVTIDQGRQHQIRAHLCLYGTPIWGDKLYGMGDEFFQRWVLEPGCPELVAQLPIRWHCLHAERLELPIGDEVRTYEAPLPAGWPSL